MNELSLFTHVTESLTTNDYYTPKWLFDAMGLEFDIDVCAPAHGIPWIPAKRWFSEADDGLAQEWGGELVWMNPPFSNATPWANKFMENNNGVALICVSRSKWFNKIWDLADAIMPTPADFKFERPGVGLQTISTHTFLFALGKPATVALQRAKLARVR